MAEPQMTTDLEPQVAQLNIGELLASKRHQRNESIADVAAKVRLSPDAVEKLESNRFDAIGAAVYVRGYLGVYAKYLGLDAAYLIGQYNHQFPAEEVAIRPSAGHAIGAGRQQSKRYSKTMSFLVAGLVTGSLVYGYSRVEPMLLEKGLGQFGTNAVQQPLVTPTQDSNAPTLTTVINGVEAANNLANDALNGVPVAGSGSLVTDIELDLATSPAVFAAAQDEASEKENTPERENTTTITVPTIKLTSAQTTQEEEKSDEKPITKPKTVALTMAFKAECWVKVTDANDKVLTSRLYKAKSKLNVKGVAPLNMVVGNPGVVQSAKLNGKPMRLSTYKVGRIKYSIAPQTTATQ